MNQNRKIIRTVVGNAPTVLVLAALGGLGFLGHKTGWKIPRWSANAHDHGSAEREDWCETHAVPESKCLACHPELAGNDPRDWCKEHGVPESKCTVCHPELLKKGTASDWCSEHGVPESQCTACHPEIAVKGAAPAPVLSTTVSAEPVSSPETCQLHHVKIQFASAGSVHKAGIKLEAIQERPMVARVESSGELDYDSTRLARITARVPGLLSTVEKRVGDPVKKGEVLALVDSVDVGRARAELLHALAQLDLRTRTNARVAPLAASGIKTAAELIETEAALREAKIRVFDARQALANLGLACDIGGLQGLGDEALVERVRGIGLTTELAARTTTANLLPLTSPLDGVVVARDGVAGEAVEQGRAVFVADTSRLWMNASLPVEDAALVRIGQKVSFVPDGDREDAVAGVVSWISTEVDERARVVRVRAEVENPEGRLRAHAFGRARIVTRESPTAVAVPNEAIQWEGCCHVVFVRLTDEVFLTRKVRLGARSGAFTEVQVGVLPGEVVATEGSHVLKRELLRSRLGAGCCD